jgi:hypothetical protein
LVVIKRLACGVASANVRWFAFFDLFSSFRNTGHPRESFPQEILLRFYRNPRSDQLQNQREADFNSQPSYDYSYTIAPAVLRKHGQDPMSKRVFECFRYTTARELQSISAMRLDDARITTHYHRSVGPPWAEFRNLMSQSAFNRKATTPAD